MPGEWSSFYEGVSSAAAALAGLVFVAISINLARILAIAGLAARAAETLVLLAAALFAALVALIPGQSLIVTGAELGIVSILAWAIPVAFHVAASRGHHYQRRSQFLLRIALHQAATLPLLAASAALVGSAPAGCYWLAVGVLLALAAGLLNAWVLLVEIVR